MVRREIEIDEDTDRLLNELASEYNGDLNSALADLIRSYEGIEALAERSEEGQGLRLRTLRERAESEFQEGRIMTWQDVKRNNRL